MALVSRLLFEMSGIKVERKKRDRKRSQKKKKISLWDPKK